MKHLFDSISVLKKGKWAKNSQLLAKSVLQDLQPNDVIVIKGSLGSKMKLIVDKIAMEK